MSEGSKSPRIDSGRILRAIAFGLLGFIASFVSLRFESGSFSIDMHWGFMLPLMVAIAYGPVYGFVSGLVGLGAFFPFLLWFSNGWPNLLTTVLHLLWFVYQGYFAQQREQCPKLANRSVIVFAPFSMFYVLATVYAFPVLFAMNPPPWNPNAMSYMAPEVINSIAAKGVVLMFGALITGATLLRVRLVRRIFNLPIKIEQKNNGKILFYSIIFGLGSWIVLKLFNAIFIDLTFPYQVQIFNNPYEPLGLIVCMLIAISVASVYIEFEEKRIVMLDERERLEKQLEFYATTDSLTGILNRRTGILFLENAMKESKRSKQPLAICFVDINYVKAVNDEYGHIEGDDMIKIVSNTLKEVLRESDNICRLGGDEFLMILPSCSRLDVQRVMNRAEEKLQDYNSNGVKPYKISLSYGFAEYGEGSLAPVEALIEAADKEMYQMKQTTKLPDEASLKN